MDRSDTMETGLVDTLRVPHGKTKWCITSVLLIVYCVSALTYVFLYVHQRGDIPQISIENIWISVPKREPSTLQVEKKEVGAFNGITYWKVENVGSAGELETELQLYVTDSSSKGEQQLHSETIDLPGTSKGTQVLLATKPAGCNALSKEAGWSLYLEQEDSGSSLQFSFTTEDNKCHRMISSERLSHNIWTTVRVQATGQSVSLYIDDRKVGGQSYDVDLSRLSASIRPLFIGYFPQASQSPKFVGYMSSVIMGNESYHWKDNQLRGPKMSSPQALSIMGGDIPDAFLRGFGNYDLSVLHASTMPSPLFTRLNEAQATDLWAEEVKEAMRHAYWNGIKKAWGRDEVNALNGNGKDWVHLGCTLIDSLSTLWIMNLMDEFDEITAWVTNDFDISKSSPNQHSVFEIIIRIVGGLLSAHSLSGRPIFLQRAKEVADQILPAFSGSCPFPASTIAMANGRPGSNHGSVVTAEPTTLQLEFRYLSQQTGDMKYQDLADKAMRKANEILYRKGLVGTSISCSGSTSGNIVMGGQVDSYYEYLLKMYLQTGKREPEWYKAWRFAMDQMLDKLVHTSAHGAVYVDQMTPQGQKLSKMDHLSCFVPGMMMLGKRSVSDDQFPANWEEVAGGITETCGLMYSSPTGLAPEVVHVSNHGTSKQDDISMPGGGGKYSLLRPEAVESMFHMWHYTQDPKYRMMARKVLDGIQLTARAKYGYTSVEDVTKIPPPSKGHMESFVLAETFKYLYLIFAKPGTFDFESYVFNTEAHPLKIYDGVLPGGDVVS